MPKPFFVSIIIPCRNEENYIGNLLESIISIDYSKQQLEVLAVDGRSSDKTRMIIEGYVKRFPFIHLIDNPDKFTNFAVNIGIKRAAGDAIIIMGAHAVYQKDYITKCVCCLQEYGADSVGGSMEVVSSKDSVVSNVIAAVLSSQFGAGNAYYKIRHSKEPLEVDTVFGGCYKKSVFDKIGLFNLNLIRSQDMEFNLRLKKAGGKIMLCPDIKISYYPKTDLKDFLIHNFRDGVWAVYPFKFMKMPLKLRHYIPLFFVVAIIALGIGSFFWMSARAFLFLIVAAYILLDLFFSIAISIKKCRLSYVFVAPVVFMVRHFSYGMGSLWGLIKLFGKNNLIENEKQDIAGSDAGSSLVTVVIPCRNEEKSVAKCLDSILAQDYSRDHLEVFVVDGMSEDGTKKIIDDYSFKHNFIRLLENPDKTTPFALNKAIRAARGEIIVRMDAHSSYKKDYVSKCVRNLKISGADNVGGISIISPRTNSFTSKAIALSLSSFFGAGNARYRISVPKSWQEVDTVHCGCYRSDVFRRIGMFDERLSRSQDMEFNLRLKNAGGKILLFPDIVSYYYPKSTFKEFFIHNLNDGIWAIYPLKFVKVAFQPRHYAPLLFVFLLLLLGAMSFSSPKALFLLFYGIAVYLLVSLCASIMVAFKERNPAYVLVMPLVFAVRHVGYGAGSLWGIIKLLFGIK
jgi:glycosyltransferase involved in cell wall biosynthesis